MTNDPRDKITTRRCGECGASATADKYFYTTNSHTRTYACHRSIFHLDGEEHDLDHCRRSPAGHKRIRDNLLLDLQDAIRGSDVDPITRDQLLAAITDAT